VINVEQNPYIWLYFMPNKVTSHHVLEVTMLRQAQLDARCVLSVVRLSIA
jgi:hypothetical protein